MQFMPISNELRLHTKRKKKKKLPTFCVRNKFSYFSADTSDPLLNDNISLCDKIMAEIRCMQAGRRTDGRTDSNEQSVEYNEADDDNATKL